MNFGKWPVAVRDYLYFGFWEATFLKAVGGDLMLWEVLLLWVMRNDQLK